MLEACRAETWGFARSWDSCAASAAGINPGEALYAQPLSTLRAKLQSWPTKTAAYTQWRQKRYTLLLFPQALSHTNLAWYLQAKSSGSGDNLQWKTECRMLLPFALCLDQQFFHRTFHKTKTGVISPHFREKLNDEAVKQIDMVFLLNLSFRKNKPLQNLKHL